MRCHSCFMVLAIAVSTAVCGGIDPHRTACTCDQSNVLSEKTICDHHAYGSTTLKIAVYQAPHWDLPSRRPSRWQEQQPKPCQTRPASPPQGTAPLVSCTLRYL